MPWIAGVERERDGTAGLFIYFFSWAARWIVLPFTEPKTTKWEADLLGVEIESSISNMWILRCLLDSNGDVE